MTGDSDILQEARQAWHRLRDHGRKNWTDWITVAKALTLGRAAAMTGAKSNKPMGYAYNKLFGEWLREQGLDEISNQERYRAIQCLERLDDIEEWRRTLPETKAPQAQPPVGGLVCVAAVHKAEHGAEEAQGAPVGARHRKAGLLATRSCATRPPRHAAREIGRLPHPCPRGTSRRHPKRDRPA